ncbi:MAG TPA: lipopolysaccharide heptosyltransferase I [Tepidisphaeraceae bacterium]|nr:lipopolysaccharide heptosyltransferase I [Tepidisphaeraceae bacterium]
MTPIDLPNPPKKILIIKPSALGDIVHTLPVLNLLRKKWPTAHISWLISSSFASLIQGHPQLDEIIMFDSTRFGRGWYDPREAFRLIKFLNDLGQHEFDLVIDLQGLQRSGWLSAFTDAPVRIGFANAREWAHLFYTHRVAVDSLEQHAIDRYLTLTDALGCGREPIEFQFVTDEKDRAHVDSLVGGIGKFAVLLPGTNWVTKRWPVERFADLIKPLRERFGLASVVGGGGDVMELSCEIPADVNAVGKTSLRELVALLDRAELVIANDSGPMHIAAALKKPLVTMYGPTNPIRTGPYQRMDSVVRVDILCSPCYSRKCSHISCMKFLETEPVLALAAEQISSAV